MRMRRSGFLVLVTAGLAVGWIGVAAAAMLTPADRCEARKLKAAGEKAECLLEQEADEMLGKTPRFAKCSDKFTKAFVRAEAKAGPGVCSTEGDAAAVEAEVDACVAAIATLLSGNAVLAQHYPATGQTTCWDSAGTVTPCTGTGHDGDVQAGATLSYTDNGNGTITDNNTGLMWEKKSDDGSIHDKDNIYTWADAFAVHLAGLNAGAGFAGHTDWRLPNVKELVSIVNYENANPSVSPAFNAACVATCTVLNCSCTLTFFDGQATAYWSSSSISSSPNFMLAPPSAWFVGFVLGAVGGVDKSFSLPVRAVRGGL